jgi:hypothetical protein
MLNKQHLPILREMVVLLQKGAYRHLCPAANAARHRLELEFELGQEVRDHISQEIDHASTLEDWLYDIGCRPDVITYDTMRLCRLAWLDRMIADLEAQP